MTADPQLERIVRSWLEPGLTTLTDDVLDAVLDQLPATPQRRRWSPARRIASMNPIAKFAIAAAAVVVVVIVGYNLLRPSASSQVGNDSSPSNEPSPSASPAPTVPASGLIDAGRYRWVAPGGEVSFVVPDGWSARPDGGIVKNAETSAEIGLFHNIPGSTYEVTHVYADACHSESALQPIGDTVDDLIEAVDAQESTDAVTSEVISGSVVGQRIEVRQPAALADRSDCRYGEAEGPLQIWADEAETWFFALPPDFWGRAYVFDVDGTRFVFNVAFGPEVSNADVQEVDAIVESFEFSTP